MKYSIRADVEGVVFLEEPDATVSGQYDGVAFELRSDASKRLRTITVLIDVPADVAERMHVTFGPKPANPQYAPPLTFEVDPEIDHAAQRHLQTIESLLSFISKQNALVRIRWSEGAASIIPETDDERKRVQADGFQIKKQFPRAPMIIPSAFFQKLVTRAGRYSDLIEPMAFLREAANRQEDGDYIQAFHSYYFILEGLYAGGRSSESQIVAEFGRSKTFNDVCKAALQFFEPDGPAAKDAGPLLELFKLHQCEVTVDGVQRFLVRMRNQLHHFSRKSTRVQPHPFNQDTFAPVARFAALVATVALQLEKVLIDQSMLPKNQAGSDR